MGFGSGSALLETSILQGANYCIAGRPHGLQNLEAVIYWGKHGSGKNYLPILDTEQMFPC